MNDHNGRTSWRGLASKTDYLGQVTDYQYDADNRLEAMRNASADKTPVQLIYGRDRVG